MRTDDTRIGFPDERVTITANVTPLGKKRYRLDTVPPLAESAGYRDVIEADELEDGSLRVVRVTEKSDWNHYSFILKQEVIEGSEIAALRERVAEHGGYSERLFGGILFIALPPEVDWDPTPEVMGFSRETAGLPFESDRRRLLLVLLACAAALGAAGYLWWTTRLRNFRGWLRLLDPELVYIPEDPPPPAWLVTPAGTYELDVPRYMLGRSLSDLDGKEVIVLGRWGYRRTMMRKHRAIRVHDLKLANAP